METTGWAGENEVWAICNKAETSKMWSAWIGALGTLSIPQFWTRQKMGTGPSSATPLATAN